MSSQFASASAWLSSSSSPENVPNETKLELYGLFKFANTSTGPTGQRPGVFSFEGRAKYDAWARVSSDYGDDVERAKRRYVEIARDLGWQNDEGTTPLASSSKAQTRRAPTGFGPTVSVMEREAEQPDTSSSVIHDAASEGNITALKTLLESDTSRIRVNERDQYGFTALHLAADRGHASAVRLLLSSGADKSIPDPDGQTALDIAQVLDRDEVIQLLQ